MVLRLRRMPEIVALRIRPSTTLLVVNADRDDVGETTGPDASESDRRRQALDQMVDIAHDAGIWGNASPKRTR
jgi:hypothetical protein